MDPENTYLQWSKMIDHALLQPQSTQEELRHGIDLAANYQVASVCLLPYAVAMAAELLRESDVLTTTTIGFPHGAHATKIKAAEAEDALENGADELDMVINISQLKSGNIEYVEHDIDAVLQVVRAANKRLKVIFEMAYLDRSEKIAVARICDALGVDWVKTSTGFASSGATVEDVTLLRQSVGEHVQVKAAGGIRTFAQLEEMRRLGATRCGASGTAHILEEARRTIGLAPLSDAGATAAPRTDSKY